MTFALESNLCSVLTGRLLEVLRLKARAELLGSLQVGSVIPDLVAVRRERLSSQRDRRVSGLESWIVSELLRSPGATSALLADRLFTRLARAERAICRLQRAEVLRRLPTGGYVVRRGLFPNAAEVIAVEAKLHRWREAIEQATTYRRFANRSFVALPRATIEGSAQISEACRERGLGLIAVWSSGAKVVRPAVRHRPASAEWVWVVGQAADWKATRTRSAPVLGATPAGAPTSSAH